MRLAASGLVMAGVVCVFFISGGSAALEARVQAPSGPVREARVLEQERTGVPSPVGLAFSSASEAFYVVGARPGALPEIEVVKLTPFDLSSVSDRSGAARIAAAVSDPINMAFDARHNRLLLLGHARQLLEVQAVGSDLDRQSLKGRDAARFDLKDPQGMAVDPASGTVYILDAGLPRIVRVEPAADGSFETGAMSEIDLRPSGHSDLRGLALDPSTGHLHVGSGKTLVELTQAGEVITTRDLSGLALAQPEGMVFAPSGDQTDDPAQLSVYVADSGSGGKAGSSGPSPSAGQIAAPSAGQIIEVSLAAQASIAAADFTSQLIRTVNMGALDPPSPDPSGITYVSAGDKLVIVDGEVEETVQGITHFEGANVWELTRSGSIIRTANISKVEPTDAPMTDEPTGVAFNNGHYFVTEDGGKRVYELSPGADGLVGTADDSWSFFRTNISPNDNGDPEGIAFGSNQLFVADGVNREIYKYSTSGTLLGHFDVAQYGVQDPETVEFNPVSGTLFVLSNRQSGPIIVETTINGALIQTIDVSAAGAIKPAGLAYANASNGSGVKRFYWVDRGIDNNSNPNIVDGKMYEMTAPGGAPPGNQPPVITSDGGGATAALSRPENQTFVTDVNATDPNAGDTITYSISGGADAARFTINPSTGVLAFLVAPNFEAPTDVGANNVYDVVARASDGSLSDTQAIAVTVTNVAEGGGSPLYFSLLDPATVGGVAAEDEDVIFFNGSGFSLAFDGSDVGIAGLRIDGFSFLNATTLLLSFDTAGTVPGITGTTDDSDIVRFASTSLGSNTSGSFSLHVDGSAVGLTTSGEDVDAVERLPNGHILISTVNTVTVAGLTGEDEDLLDFDPATGTFSLYFDGSSFGLTTFAEDVDAAAVDASGKIDLSTLNNFSVTGVSGANEDVFVFTPSTGTYSSTLYFDGSVHGLTANDVSAIDLP